MACYARVVATQKTPDASVSSTQSPAAEPSMQPTAPDPLDEAAFLEQYRPEDFPRPAVAVDIAIFTILDADLKILLIQRQTHPFRGAWALPGGFLRVGPSRVDQGEDLAEAAQRRLAEETRLPRGAAYLEQLQTFGRAGRDPRMRVISVSYFALVRPDLAPFVAAGEEALDARWVSLSALGKQKLAFDHREIIEFALTTIRSRIENSNLAFELVPESFSIPELRAVHEVIKGVPQDPGNFRRKFNRLVDDGIIEPAIGKRITASKPAAVYRFKK